MFILVNSLIAQQKIKIKSGKYSGVEYLMINGKSLTNEHFVIFIECKDHKESGGAKGIFIRKEVFDKRKTYVKGYFLVLDSTMLSESEKEKPLFPVDDGEFAAMSQSILKYPAISIKYSLSIDILKRSLGWLEVKQE